jgi:hypothetical protein
MNEISKTSAAAAKAVAKSQKKDAAVRTPEMILKDISSNLEAKWAVTPDDTRFLLASYNAAIAAMAAEVAKNAVLTEQIAKLQEKNDDLMKVYAAENQAQTVVSFFEPPTEGEVAPTPGSGE